MQRKKMNQKKETRLSKETVSILAAIFQRQAAVKLPQNTTVSNQGYNGRVVLHFVCSFAAN